MTSVEELKLRVRELENELIKCKQKRCTAMCAEEPADNTQPHHRPRIDKMSAEVVDSNPYRYGSCRNLTAAYWVICDHDSTWYGWHPRNKGHIPAYGVNCLPHVLTLQSSDGFEANGHCWRLWGNILHSIVIWHTQMLPNSSISPILKKSLMQDSWISGILKLYTDLIWQ